MPCTIAMQIILSVLIHYVEEKEYCSKFRNFSVACLETSAACKNENLYSPTVESDELNITKA